MKRNEKKNNCILLYLRTFIYLDVVTQIYPVELNFIWIIFITIRVH